MELEVITHKATGQAKATPVLFVHGAWGGAWCWEEYFLPCFAAQGYHAHALSLRGHGASAGQERLRWTRLSDYVADVAQVASRLPAAPVLVGHSMGGLIVQKYLESHTAPLGVLLASVPVGGVLRATLGLARRHPLAFLKANLTLSPSHLIGTPALYREALFSPAMPAERVNRYFAQMQQESYLAFLAMLFSRPKPDRVHSPILVYGAGNDRLFHLSEIEATAKAYHTEAVIFPDLAHGMNLEMGWQAVADRLLAELANRGL